MTTSFNISRRSSNTGVGATELILGTGLTTKKAFTAPNGLHIDGHLHFFKPANSFHGWPGSDQTAIYRDNLPIDVAPLMSNSGMDGAVVVEAAMNQEETEWLLELAAENPMIRTVIGWVAIDDIESVDVLAKLAGCSKQVDAWAAHPNTYIKFSGFISSAASEDATYDTFKPYFDKLWETFGPDRLIYASDWPAMTLLRGDTLEVWSSICWAYLDDIGATETERDAFLGGTAARAYKI